MHNNPGAVNKKSFNESATKKPVDLGLGAIDEICFGQCKWNNKGVPIAKTMTARNTILMTKSPLRLIMTKSCRL